jgi:hypothetical protein
MADDAVVRMARMRRAMAKMRREGRQAEFDVLVTAYEALKAEHVERVHEERREAARARAAARRAQEARVRPQRWRLPAGFGVSPLAARRAREARPGWVVPVGRPALSPWRRGGGLMSETIWRP